MLAVHNLDIRQAAIARRSSRAEPWQVEIVRPLGPEDFALLQLPSTAPDPRAPLSRIRDPHHMMARLLAQGKAPIEVSAITGYTPARIRTLQNDPAFQELLHHYTAQEMSVEADVTAQIRHLALSAAATLQERLEAEPESFSNKELRELAQTGFDRIGHGPSSKVDLRLTNPQGVIQQLKEALAAEAAGRILTRDDAEGLPPPIEAEYTLAPEAPNG